MLTKFFRALLFILLTTGVLQAQTVTFNVTTVTYNGKYAPKNCFAIWVTNASGTYIKTINRQSKNYTSYLTNWYSNSSNKSTDGVTGASLNSHNYAYTSQGGSISRIPFSWNCQDYNGNTVADGTYYINVEFTEHNGTGKTAKYTFVKGTTNQSISYSNVSSYFTNATLSYTAPATALENTTTESASVLYQKEDKTLQIQYDEANHSQVQLTIYNLSSVTCKQQALTSGTTSLNLSKLPNGLYMVKLTDTKNCFKIQKILKQ
jgi:hypothetical protein